MGAAGFEPATSRAANSLAVTCALELGQAGEGAIPTHERSQALPFSILPEHRLPIDAKGDLGVAVADLSHDVRRIIADCEQERGERPPEGVGR